MSRRELFATTEKYSFVRGMVKATCPFFGSFQAANSKKAKRWKNAWCGSAEKRGKYADTKYQYLNRTIAFSFFDAEIASGEIVRMCIKMLSG